MASLLDPSEIKLLFAYAAERGLAGPRARQAFDRGVDAGWGLTALSPEGFTALGVVCQRGQPALASRLLRAGADPELRGANHLAPLSLAVANPSTDCALLLLSHGADPDTKTLAGSPVLTLAASAGSKPIVMGLARAGATLDLRDAFGRNALILATACKHQGVVRDLIRLRAPLDSVDHKGRTALIYSALHMHYGIFFDLLKNANPLIRGKDGLGALEVLGVNAGMRMMPAMAAALHQATSEWEARALTLVISEPVNSMRRPTL